MNHRLEQFLAAENISQAQFADTIGVARASISHILAGRNKPGYDFIVSTALHYPTLSLDWLLCGKGRMYRGDLGYSESAGSPVAIVNQASEAPAASVASAHGGSAATAGGCSDVEFGLFDDANFEEKDVNCGRDTRKIADMPESKVETICNKSHRISKIVVFYNDNTFEEYNGR